MCTIPPYPFHRAPSRPPYPSEFKTEAVRLHQQSGKNLQEIADDLGISTNSLREWVRRAESNGAPNGKSRMGLSQDEREELKQLQRENHILREEREILKKAAASCALRVSLLRRPTRPASGVHVYRAEKAFHPIALMCRLFGVSKSGYYARNLSNADCRSCQRV